jgi:hypothetical protein
LGFGPIYRGNSGWKSQVLKEKNPNQGGANSVSSLAEGERANSQLKKNFKKCILKFTKKFFRKICGKPCGKPVENPVENLWKTLRFLFFKSYPQVIHKFST